MRSRITFSIAAAALAFTTLGIDQCPGDPTPPPSTQWYYTCGDPVCRGYTGPYEGIPLCDDQEAGDPCRTDGQRCDPQDECNALLLCAETDPTAQGCPISRAAYKQDIHYLGASELGALHKQVLGAPLATWKYKSEGSEGKTRLGFIIEDLPSGSLAVDEPRDMVDVYGWATMAVAAIKVQQAQIEALQTEVSALKERLGETPAAAPAAQR